MNDSDADEVLTQSGVAPAAAAASTVAAAPQFYFVDRTQPASSAVSKVELPRGAAGAATAVVHLLLQVTHNQRKSASSGADCHTVSIVPSDAATMMRVARGLLPATDDASGASGNDSNVFAAVLRFARMTPQRPSADDASAAEATARWHVDYASVGSGFLAAQPFERDALAPLLLLLGAAKPEAGSRRKRSNAEEPLPASPFAICPPDDFLHNLQQQQQQSAHPSSQNHNTSSRVRELASGWELASESADANNFNLQIAVVIAQLPQPSPAFRAALQPQLRVVGTVVPRPAAASVGEDAGKKRQDERVPAAAAPPKTRKSVTIVENTVHTAIDDDDDDGGGAGMTVVQPEVAKKSKNSSSKKSDVDAAGTAVAAAPSSALGALPLNSGRKKNGDLLAAGKLLGGDSDDDADNEKDDAVSVASSASAASDKRRKDAKADKKDKRDKKEKKSKRVEEGDEEDGDSAAAGSAEKGTKTEKQALGGKADKKRAKSRKDCDADDDDDDEGPEELDADDDGNSSKRTSKAKKAAAAAATSGKKAAAAANTAVSSASSSMPSVVALSVAPNSNMLLSAATAATTSSTASSSSASTSLPPISSFSSRPINVVSCGVAWSDAELKWFQKWRDAVQLNQPQHAAPADVIIVDPDAQVGRSIKFLCALATAKLIVTSKWIQRQMEDASVSGVSLPSPSSTSSASSTSATAVIGMTPQQQQPQPSQQYAYKVEVMRKSLNKRLPEFAADSRVAVFNKENRCNVMAFVRNATQHDRMALLAGKRVFVHKDVQPQDSANNNDIRNVVGAFGGAAVETEREANVLVYPEALVHKFRNGVKATVVAAQSARKASLAASVESQVGSLATGRIFTNNEFYHLLLTGAVDAD